MQYPTAGFDGRVERIECQDHNPPKMNQIISFVERASSFLEEDKQRVIAVHCKGGKGRTGLKP
jgi:PTEN phosphatase family protein